MNSEGHDQGKSLIAKNVMITKERNSTNIPDAVFYPSICHENRC